MKTQFPKFIISTVLIAMIASCSNKENQWNNTVSDIKQMRAAWATGEKIPVFAADNSRYGRNSGFVIKVYNYYNNATKLDTQISEVLHSQPVWISASTLKNKIKSGEVQAKADKLFALYSEYRIITLDAAREGIFPELPEGRDLKEEYSKQLTKGKLEEPFITLEYFKIASEYFNKLSLLLQFVSGKTVVNASNKIQFKTDNDLNNYKIRISEVSELEKKIQSMELEWLPRRKKLINQAREQ